MVLLHLRIEVVEFIDEGRTHSEAISCEHPKAGVYDHLPDYVVGKRNEWFCPIRGVDLLHQCAQ